MNTKSYDPNAPRLTAYALGELDAADRAEVESQLEHCEESRATVDDVRETAELIRGELASEPTAALTETQRAAVEVEADASSSAPVRPAGNRKQPTRRRTVFAAIAVVVVMAPVLFIMFSGSVIAPFMYPIFDSEEDAAVARLDGQPNSDDSSSDAVWNEAAGSPDPNSTAYAKRSLPQARSQEEESFEYALPEGALVNRNKAGWVSGVVSTDIGGDAPGKRGSHRYDSGEKSVGDSAGQEILQSENVSPGDIARIRSYRTRLEQSKVSVAPAQNTSSTARPPATGPVPTNAPGKDGRTFANVPGANGQRSIATEPVKKNGAGRYAQSAISPGIFVKRGTVAAPSSQLATTGGSRSLGLERERESLAKTQKPVATSESIGGGLGGRDVQKGGFAARQLEVRDLQSNPNNESYEPIHENEFLSPVQQPLSTVSVDVDTASYSNVRRFLTHGQWPNPNAVRIEEMINYFHYDYPQPKDDTPFSVNIEVDTCPWQTDHRLVRVGLKGKEISRDQRPPSSLVFLIDASGSMRDNNKLPLVKSSLQLLVEDMTEDDRIAIVTYSGSAGLQLDSTSGEHKPKIMTAINSLKAGGSTNGESGIKMAYDKAIQHFIKDGTNRIILCTDGDFNVGVSSDNELVTMIQDKARSGVFLSIFGFGMGNLKDSKLEKLADKGNGHYGYVDNLKEARKIFVEEMTGTLYTIAKDVKVQIEFNPFQVGAYRLIGYENRLLAAQDFNDDTKDAGDIGAGHTVTALYEIVPVDKLPKPNVDPLKYQRKPGVPAEGEAAAAKASKELLTLKLRYKQPNADKSVRRDFPVIDKRDKNVQPSSEFEWAAAVASFGMILRHSQHNGQSNYDHVLEMALGSKGPDKSGHRREFIDLLYRARVIQARQQGLPTPEPPQLTDEVARQKATVRGKYKRLLKTIPVPGDAQVYGPFSDYGLWTSTAYAGHDKLPEGHWVYVYPNWYIWGDAR